MISSALNSNTCFGLFFYLFIVRIGPILGPYYLIEENVLISTGDFSLFFIFISFFFCVCILSANEFHVVQGKAGLSCLCISCITKWDFKVITTTFFHGWKQDLSLKCIQNEMVYKFLSSIFS